MENNKTIKTDENINLTPKIESLGEILKTHYALVLFLSTDLGQHGIYGAHILEGLLNSSHQVLEAYWRLEKTIHPRRKRPPVAPPIINTNY